MKADSEFEMHKRVMGMSATSDRVTFVDAMLPENCDQPIEILADGTWKLQKGDRPEAYQVLHQQCGDYVREAKIDLALIKASAVPQARVKLGVLHSAEVRGVVTAAAAVVCDVKHISKAVVSRTFGDRKVDEYIDDEAFWNENVLGEPLRKTSREVAMLLVASRGI